MRCSWILVGVCTMLMAGSLKGQTCAGDATTWTHPGIQPSFLAMITGSYDRPSKATWDAIAAKQAQSDSTGAGSRATMLLNAGKPEAALQLLAPRLAMITGDSVAASALDPAAVADLEVAAMAQLVLGKLDPAAKLLDQAVPMAGATQHCRLRMEQLLVAYLQDYGMEAPLFVHFNSGFYNFLQDSLRWEPNSPDGGAYLMSLNVVILALRLDSQHQALYLELLGDLLSKEPNRFNANYLSALAYIRAGQVLGEKAAAVYDRKAMFALEAPRQAEIRFNQYRFTQLKKSLQSDADSAAMRQTKQEAIEAADLKNGRDPLARFNSKSSNALSSATFEDHDFGQLPSILKKSRSQLDAREADFKRYAGDVDLKKEVKKDSRFNTFALFLILTIVGAIVFIWRKIRLASK